MHNGKIKALSLTAGAVWGVCVMVITWLCMFTGYGAAFLLVLASIYPGLSISFLGSIIGLIYGFLDGFISVYIFCWVYGKFAAKHCRGDKCC